MLQLWMMMNKNFLRKKEKEKKTNLFFSPRVKKHTMSITFIDWNDMDFGDIKLPLCGICGKHQAGKGDYSRVTYTVTFKNGMEKEVSIWELTQDIICEDCEDVWEWDDDNCGYRKK